MPTKDQLRRLEEIKKMLNQRRGAAIIKLPQFFTEIVTFGGIILKRFRSNSKDTLILPPDMGMKEAEELEQFHEEIVSGKAFDE